MLLVAVAASVTLGRGAHAAAQLPPPPQAQLYVTGPPTPLPAPITAASCPGGSELGVDRDGVPTCLVHQRRHGVAHVPLGLGIGMLAGGYVMTLLTTLLAPSNGGAAWERCFGGVSGCSSGYTDSAYTSFGIWGDIPLLGPWVQLGYLPPHIDEGAYVLWVFEGLLEITGLATLIVGIVGEDVEEDVPLRGFVWRVRPMLSASAQGLSAELRF